MKYDNFKDDDPHEEETNSIRVMKRGIMTSIKWNIGNSICCLFAFVIAVVALSRTTNAMYVEPAITTSLQPAQTTDLTVYDPELVKRVTPWFVLGLVVGVANFGALLYGLASSCKDFSQSTGNKFSCIYGAISTAITIAGASWTGWKKYLEIGNALLNVAKKRDAASLAKRAELESELVAHFESITGLTAEFVGHKAVLRVYAELKKASTSYVPTVKLTTPHNVSFHFAIEQRSDNSFTSLLGNIVGTDTETTKREDFDKESFSKGGIEFTHYYVAKEDMDNGVLNQQNDWHTVYDQVNCKVGKEIMNNNGDDYVEYQIYDNVNRGTIAAGTIVGFDDQPAGFHGLNEEPSGLPEDASCAID